MSLPPFHPPITAIAISRTLLVAHFTHTSLAAIFPNVQSEPALSTLSTFSPGCSRAFFYPSLGQAESPQKHELPHEVSAREEAISSIHTLLSVSALQLTNICDTLYCSQPSLSSGIVKDPLDVSQFISATNRHKTDKLLPRVREMWQREFVGETFSDPKLRNLRQTLALGDEHTGMWFLFPAMSSQWTS